MKCQDCKFMQADKTECRRYAPQPSDDSATAKWPTVALDDWCGEFVSKKDEEAAKAA